MAFTVNHRGSVLSQYLITQLICAHRLPVNPSRVCWGPRRCGRPSGRTQALDLSALAEFGNRYVGAIAHGRDENRGRNTEPGYGEDSTQLNSYPVAGPTNSCIVPPAATTVPPAEKMHLMV